LHERIGAYHELVVAQLDAIEPKYADLKPVGFDVIDLGDPKREVYNLSERLLRDYPIVRAYFGILFSDSAFERIRDFIDWDYFSKAEAEVGS
jgi:hypothetical protein